MKRPRYIGWIYKKRISPVTDALVCVYRVNNREERAEYLTSEGALYFFNVRVGKPVQLLLTPVGLRVYAEVA